MVYEVKVNTDIYMTIEANTLQEVHNKYGEMLKGKFANFDIMQVNIHEKKQEETEDKGAS